MNKKQLMLPLVTIIVLSSFALVKIKFMPDINFLNIVFNLFPRTEKHSDLDVAWDYVIVDNPDKSGKNKWVIGLTDNKINIYETATAPVVQVRAFKEIDMHYTSMEDYYSRGGSKAFRKFIEDHNK